MVTVQAAAGYRFSLFQIDKTIAADEFLRYHHVRDFPDQQGSVVDFEICLLDQFTSELDMAFPDERCVKIKPVFRMQAGRAKFAVTLSIFSTALVRLLYYTRMHVVECVLPRSHYISQRIKARFCRTDDQAA